MTRKLTKIPLKVIPGASSNGIAGWLGDSLRIRVTAAPEQGKANAAVETIIAQALGLRKQAVRIVAGNTSARKLIEIEGLSEAEIMHRLGRDQQE